MQAQKQEVGEVDPSECEETLVASRKDPPFSIVRASTAPDLPRDTILDPPRASWVRRALLTLWRALMFLPRLVVYAILREWRAFWVRFEDPPLCDLLPDPAPPLKRRNAKPTPEELAELIAHELYQVPKQYRAGLSRIARIAYETRHEGEEAQLDRYVHFAVSRLARDRGELIPIVWIRRRLDEVERRKLNAALERIAEAQWIELLDNNTDDPVYVAQGIARPGKKVVTHVRLLDWP